jgi:hypothetical protein
MAHLWGNTYTRQELLQRVGDISQLAAAQPFELVDGSERGVRGVWLRSAGGLEMAVAADRGMGITSLSFRGIPLPFISAVGVAHPAYAEATPTGWLRNWPAGFLTPCGLTQVGSPCNDQGEALGLHGRLSNLPARNVSWGGEWQKDDYTIYVQGMLRETAVFGENIVLKRRIWMKLGEPRFWVEDWVENQGFNPSAHMFLQHINLGFPLVSASTRLELPERHTQPRDIAAQPGLDHCCEFSEPVAGYQEQVFYHELEPDPDGMVVVRLVNPDFNYGGGLQVSISYRRSEYPVLVEWKMMDEGLYVVGLEPANCHVGGRCAEREMGTLQILEPREVRHYQLEIEFSS